MTEPNASPTPPEATTTPSPDVVVGLGGVTAQAVAGTASPNVEAAPPQAGAAAPEENTPAPTGPVPDEAAATAATPGATDGGDAAVTQAPATDAQVGQLQTAMVREVDAEARKQITTNLNAIEQIALFWGGEAGTKIRNHIGRIRDLLQ